MNIQRQYRTPAGNSTYKKLAVQWLNEALCFVSSFVVADSLVLRNRQLLVAAKRCTTLKPIFVVKTGLTIQMLPIRSNRKWIL
jgi:hypothetical protein